MDLFCDMEGKSFADVLIELNVMAEGFVKEFELPERGVKVFENIGNGKKTKGKVISYSICINEPEYPATEQEFLDENRTHIKLVTIQKKNTKSRSFLIVQVDKFMLSVFPPPNDAELLAETKTDVDNDKCRLQFCIDSVSFVEWIKSLTRHRIKNFVTSAKAFGCCSQFKECSNAGKCVHPNKLYSTACAYRRNLECGNNFMITAMSSENE